MSLPRIDAALGQLADTGVKATPRPGPGLRVARGLGGASASARHVVLGRGLSTGPWVWVQVVLWALAGPITGVAMWAPPIVPHCDVVGDLP